MNIPVSDDMKVNEDESISISLKQKIVLCLYLHLSGTSGVASFKRSFREKIISKLCMNCVGKIHSCPVEKETKN
jgi:hypothetical protein